jgi:hypothetical protein
MSHPLAPSRKVPIVCDPRGAPDTAEERIDTYRRLFADALTGRDRTETGVCLRFRADPGIEDRVRDLAALEKRCCDFFTFAIAATDDEVTWYAEVVDDDTARSLLEEWFRLPEVVNESVPELYRRWVEAGGVFVTDPLVDLEVGAGA